MNTTEFEDPHFALNTKGYIKFNSNLIINSRYKLQAEIMIDEELGSTAKGRYGSVFRVKDLKDGQIKALKINRIPPEEEDAKRQKAKDELKQQQQTITEQQRQTTTAPSRTPTPTQDQSQPTQNVRYVKRQYGRRRVKTVKERYKSSCKREIGVLKRVTRKNQNEKIPCLVLYDYGEYLGHTYMIFPVYDLPLQQHLSNVSKYQESLSLVMSNSTNPPNTAPNNALIHPDDLWAFEEQLISALSYIHNICNVMHLDFKPKNIMINYYSYDILKYAKNLHLIKLQRNKITLIDFSVSAKAPKKANLDEVRYTGNFGTRRYRPPEMIYGGKWNRSVDTYGTAMIILESIKLFPIIDTTYYKKKKILKYKKKMKKSKGNMKKPHKSNYKQLDISEVLYLIIQQTGFMSEEYWKGIDGNERNLFPKYPLIENIARKGKKSKLFDNDGTDNVIVKNKMKDMDFKQNREFESGHEWSLFSDKLQAHQGTVWSLFKQYGSNLIVKCRLDIMEESLKKMVCWDPKLRVTPEEVLKQYFPKNLMTGKEDYEDLHTNNTISNHNDIAHSNNHTGTAQQTRSFDLNINDEYN